jgi:hypothetical protein
MPSSLLTQSFSNNGIQVGPKIEYSRGDIFDDEEVYKILPFLALPDGAHLVCTLIPGYDNNFIVACVEY